MRFILVLCLFPFVQGMCGSQQCCVQGPPGQAGMPGTPGTPGTPGMPGSVGCCGSTRRWKQCTWTYSKAAVHTDNGQIHVCEFEKLKIDSYLRVLYVGNLRMGLCTGCCKRWYFTFNNTECNKPAAIDGVIYVNTNMNLHRPANIEGYCGGLAVGKVNVGFNVGNCVGSYTHGDADTSWNQANRIIIEEVEPPVA